jgi:ABC-type multidrug transport system fused ATPase/permease subunit
MEKLKKIYKNNKFLLRKIFKYSKSLFFIRLGYAIIVSLSSLATILLPKYLLEAILSDELNRVIKVLLGYFAVSISISLLGILYNNYDRVSNEKMYLNIVNEFLNKGISLDLSFFDKSESYSKYNRAFGNCCNVIDCCNNTILSVITSIIQIIMIVGVLIWVNIYVFFAVLLFVIINIVINNVLKKIDYDFSVALSEKNKQVNYFYRLFYTPQFFRDIKANVIDKFIFDKKQAINDEIINLSKSQIKKTTKFKIILGFLSTVEYVLAAFYFAYSVLIKLIAVGDYFTGLNAYMQMKNSINNLLSSYTDFYNNSLFAEDYIDFMKSEENTTTNFNGIILEASDIEIIEFSNVTFSYPNSNNYALKNVSFSINKGDKLAILGKNGAGKTTIVKLLLRLYDPQEGSILINGKNIKEYNTHSLRSSIRTLFQDFAVYAFSIHDNITLGKEISDEKIENALKEVDLFDKISHLENGINTPITRVCF